MANFGWAYVDCKDGAGISKGPTGSIQFLTGNNATSGSEFLIYHTGNAATPNYAAHSLLLSGNLLVTGSITANTVSASQFHYEDITVIDVTGSTKFGNSNDDTHIRTGSLIVGPVGSAGVYALSASVTDKVVSVAGFAGGYNGTTSNIVVSTDKHIYGVRRTSATTVTFPLASSVPTGWVVTIKDEVPARTGASNNITLTSSSPVQNLFDNEATYILTGTMPAISVYSNGTNWFVF